MDNDILLNNSEQKQPISPNGYTTYQQDGVYFCRSNIWFASVDDDMCGKETAFAKSAKQAITKLVDKIEQKIDWIDDHTETIYTQACITATRDVLVWDNQTWKQYEPDEESNLKIIQWEPDLPDCIDDQSHDWNTQNIQADGGSARGEDVCLKCKTIRYWSGNHQYDGIQGLDWVKYCLHQDEDNDRCHYFDY